MPALPAAAEANIDLAVSDTPSAKIVPVGQSVSFDATVANRGSVAFEAVYVSINSLRGHGEPAQNPYTSVSTSQGTATDTITADAPPAISGSRAIRLSGLPPGCVPGDFTLHVKAKRGGGRKLDTVIVLKRCGA